jgi:hypothetical protein
VGVWREGCIGGRDEEAARHTEVDEELRGFFLAAQIDDDGLADAVDALDAAACEELDDLVRRRFEGLGFVAGPDGADDLAVNAGVNAVSYRFDFGELGHGLLQV